ncbi:hypothetical protein HMI54_002722 [Coelomomyces lativittatus]|nr:hypothetical protein HMI54_002722 [Coelomomyces lativittatus]
MVLEATMLVIDNSEWMRNGDFVPSRSQAQADAVNLLFNIKTQSHPENAVGLMTMAGKNSSTVSISYNEKKEIIYSMKGTQPCTESSTPGTTLSLDIHLVCANEETRPQFHYVEDRCHFHLSMRTPRVCDQPVDHQNCEWDQYSLAPLRRRYVFEI